MAGDVNLFLHDIDDPYNAEIEIMIAEEKYRRKGFGRETLYLMMKYGIEKLKIKRFFSKISENNRASINLFLGLGYKEINYVKAFGEYELELIVNDNSTLEINYFSKHGKEDVYIHE